MYLLYEVALYLVLILGLPFFLLRRKYASTFSERMGHYRGAPRAHRVWIRPGSGGETLAAKPVVDAMLRLRPATSIVFTTTTATGQAQAKRLFPAATVTYFPLDFSVAVKRFLTHHKPRVFAAMETEIWPNATRLSAARGIRLVLANGRISDRSFPRYRMARPVVARVLRHYDAILAREAQDAERFRAIGAAEVEVAGNVKFDYVPDERPLELDLVALAAGRPIVVPGSAMGGEAGGAPARGAPPGRVRLRGPAEAGTVRGGGGSHADDTANSGGMAAALHSPSPRHHRRARPRLPLPHRRVQRREPRADRRPQSDRGGGGGRADVLRAAHVELPRDRLGVPAQRRGGRGAERGGGRGVLPAHDRRRRGAPGDGRPGPPHGRGKPRRRGTDGAPHRRTTGVTILLKPVELLWRGVNRVRRALYRRGVLKAKRLPQPVVSVGAITAGGAGKTPATIAIGEYLKSRGWRVAVLTRGYKRSGAGGLVNEPDAAKFGDEPGLLTRIGDVIVGKNRYQNGLAINCDVYLLDDGFQHLQLARDVDVVIDAPGKWLREGRSALGDADFVIPRRLKIDVTKGRLFAFAGLADNEQFFRAFNAAGPLSFPDHHRYTAADIAKIKQAAKGYDAIVTTEKDAVKIGDRDIIAVAARFVIDPAVLEAIEARIRR